MIIVPGLAKYLETKSSTCDWWWELLFVSLAPRQGATDDRPCACIGVHDQKPWLCKFTKPARPSRRQVAESV